MKRFSFPKKRRLLSSSQFKQVLARKVSVRDDLLTLYIAENQCGYPRLGISVGTALGKAVVRNRLKRLLREVFRQSQEQIPAGFDYLLMISTRWLKKTDGSTILAGSRSRPTFEQLKCSFEALAAAATAKIAEK